MSRRHVWTPGVFLAALCGLGIAPVDARAADGSIHVGVEIDYPPFCFVDSRGQAAGFSVELIQAAAQTMERDVTFRPGVWSEVKEWLAAGRVQALPVVGRTPEREAIFDFTTPYLSMHGAVVVRADRRDIDGFEDLGGMRVGVMRSDNAEEFLRREPRDFAIVATTTFAEALRELDAGRLDAVVVQRLVALRLIHQNGLRNLRVLDRMVPGFRQDWCFAVREGDAALLSVLNEGLALVIANGTYRQLHAKWFASLDLPARTHLLVGGRSNHPPYEFLDTNGQPAGYNVDLMRAVAAASGMEVEFRLGLWADIRAALERGELDVVTGAGYSAQRDLRMAFSAPHTVVHYVGVGRDSPPGDMRLLAGSRVAVERGDIAEEIAAANGLKTSLVSVADHEAALAAVVRGAADYAIVAGPAAAHWVAKNRWKSIRVGKSLFSAELGFAAPLNHKSRIAQLEDGLGTVKSNGQLRAIRHRWAGVDTHENGEVLRYAAYIAAPLLLLLVGALAWSWSLRRLVARRTAEARKRALQFRSLVEAAPDAILVTIAQRFAYANASACRLFGAAEPTELIGRSLLEHIDPAFHGAALERASEALAGSIAPVMEQVWLRLDGSPVPVEACSAPIDYEDTPGCLVFAADITERRRAREAAERLEAYVRQSQKLEAVGRLAGGVAHDFNNLLQGIVGFAQILQRSMLSADPLRRHVQEILRAGESAAQLTQQLLAFSRKQIINPQVVELNGVIDRAKNMLLRLIGEDVTFRFALAGDLWRTRVDPAQAEQILLNLTLNARDAMPAGGTLTITTSNFVADAGFAGRHSIERSGEFVSLTVSDTGTGIPDDVLSRIFEPFFTTKPDGKGTGLGLSTVYGIVEQHGGIVFVDTVVGEGTSFHVLLPRTHDAVDVRPDIPERYEASGQGTVLVAEDQDAVRLLVSSVLEEAGYEVLAASSGAEALEKAADRKIDLLLTDVLMPAMNGRELYERLATRQPVLPVLFMSGYSDDIIAVHGLPREWASLLKKPFTNDELLRRVHEAVSSSRPAFRRILLVDDDDAVRAGLDFFLNDAGYEVVAASSCSEALTLLGAHSGFGAAVIDQTLPDGAGTGLIDQIRVTTPLPAVLMSGAPLEDEKDGVVFLMKPFTQDDLASAIHSAVSRTASADRAMIAS